MAAVAVGEVEERAGEDEQEGQRAQQVGTMLSQEEEPRDGQEPDESEGRAHG